MSRVLINIAKLHQVSPGEWEEQTSKDQSSIGSLNVTTVKCINTRLGLRAQSSSLSSPGTLKFRHNDKVLLSDRFFVRVCRNNALRFVVVYVDRLRHVHASPDLPVSETQTSERICTTVFLSKLIKNDLDQHVELKYYHSH